MKTYAKVLLPWLFPFFSYKAIAQEEKEVLREKETEEIIIRKNGKKPATLTLEIREDQVLVNGKPMMEFKDDEISINKRKMIIREGDRMIFRDDFGGMNMGEGFSWNEGDKEKRTFLGVSTEKTDAGLIIVNVTEGSGAAKAGLLKGDILRSVDGKDIASPEDLSSLIRSKKAGDEVKIQYTRDGKKKSVKAVLSEREESMSRRVPREGMRSFSFSAPDGSMRTFTVPVPKVDIERFEMDGPGRWKEMAPFPFEGGPMDGEIRELELNLDGMPRRQKLGIRIQDTENNQGVVVLGVEDSSAAARSGLRAQDLITEVDGHPVKNTDEARMHLQEGSQKAAFPMKVRRNGQDMDLQIRIPRKLKTANL